VGMTEHYPERCAVCGFEWDAIEAARVPARLQVAAERFRAVLAGVGSEAMARPAPEIWSVIEYGCHVRDVMLNLRDRIVVGLAEDNPTPKSMCAEVLMVTSPSQAV
jgi:hypothetical protein